jgi:hypothetical protein
MVIGAGLGGLASGRPAMAQVEADATVPLETTARPVWRRHVIDATSHGADGVKFTDVNRDGRPDVVTGWEEGGVVRLYLHPGDSRAREPWPRAQVGAVPSPEDALAVDLDGDGRFEIVSATEGKDRTLYVHTAESADLLGPWRTAAFPATAGQGMWMFVAPVQLDGRHGVDLVVASKNQGATVGWLEAPAQPRDLAAWRHHVLRTAGWIMSAIPADLDGDGDADILFSDRKGERRGIGWLDNPGPARAADATAWREHAVGAAGEEVMFIDHADLDGDGGKEIVAAVQPRRIAIFRGSPTGGWRVQWLTLTGEIGTMKAVSVADLDGDGRRDLVVSCENAKGALRGMLWLQRGERGWRLHDLGGEAGTKFDLVPVLDLNGDGRPDVATTEEVDRLGVVWYENPGPTGWRGP